MKTISDQTIKKLFGLSSNICAFPKCKQILVDQKIGKVIGEICHIKAKNADGPRYDSTQNEDDRNNFDNLILLCPNHHTIIDSDIEAYTVSRLINMKKEHEQASVMELDCPENIVQQFISQFTLSTISKDNLFNPINPVGGQYAQSIQNFNGVIS